MSTNDELKRVEERLSAPGGAKRVGRLLEGLKAEGVDVSRYQPRRSTEDLVAHTRWPGVDSSQEQEELDRRSCENPQTHYDLPD
jgi:hypothetical protein